MHRHPIGLLQRPFGQSFGSIFQRYSKVADEEKYATEHITLEKYENEDEDVYKERVKVLKDKESNTSALKLVRLRKEFENKRGYEKKVAVNDVYLGFEYGECFALLGPNGVGKTTTLNIVTGALEQSSGKVYVVGKELKGSREISKFIGICPQFYVIWEDLTVRNHLEIYAKIRGCPSGKIRGIVQKAAEGVQLDGDAFNMRAGQLSGGMKRRLSIAIALLGQCPIILLDEPTTGLDVGSRREVWKILEKIRSSGQHCVILTTHAMEEADALATRIGIMVKGGLRCLGSPVHLKTRFGDGYKFNPMNTNRVFIMFVCINVSLLSLMIYFFYDV